MALIGANVRSLVSFDPYPCLKNKRGPLYAQRTSSFSSLKNQRLRFLAASAFFLRLTLGFS